MQGAVFFTHSIPRFRLCIPRISGKHPAMSATMHEHQNVQVTLDNLVYMPSLDAPADHPFPFVYFITIHNRSDNPVTLRGRKWIITDFHSEKLVIEGDGIVGQTPTIAPGGHFSYNSYHVVANPSTAEGAFYGQMPDGTWFFTRIPKFQLTPPNNQ